MIDIDILIEAEGWPEEEALLQVAQKAVDTAWKSLFTDDGNSELSLVFTDDASIRELNAQWRNMDKATNVLSFPAFPVKAGAKPGPMLGDIVIARETVMREASEEDKPFDHHLNHMIVHGFLHLLGYDHEDDSDADIMEQWERDILAALAIPDPYSQTLSNNKAG